MRAGGGGGRPTSPEPTAPRCAKRFKRKIAARHIASGRWQPISYCSGSRAHHLEGRLRYTPFDKRYDELSVSDLESLKEVREGWYVEYKSQLPSTRDLAKSLSSFANQYGGWLFLGVDEDADSQTAGSFPGIENARVPVVLESLRNAAKDIVRPQVAYQTRVLAGPDETIGLNSDRSVVVVYVPEGSNTPYIHNDGRIYIRVGDSSSPIPATDKATFDLLYRRGEDRRSYLKALIERSPEISKGEEANSFVQLNILSDPYQTLGHRYKGTYSEFCAIMQGGSIPFDNIYTASDGFIARQVGTNARYNRLLTWEFSRDCNSFITIPIPTLQSEELDTILASNRGDVRRDYSIGARFKSMLVSKGLEDSSILNLNLLLPLVSVAVSRHRTIVGQAGVRGPFYVKACIENVWRSIPFIDLKEYVDHVEEFDFPVVQDSDLTVPPGTDLGTFIFSPELENVPDEFDKITYDGPIKMWVAIMQALGIPGELLAQNGQAILDLSVRESTIPHPKRDCGPG